MASEVISHAIFASSRLFPPHPRTARALLRHPPRASLHIPLCTPPSVSLLLLPPPCLFTLNPTLHPALHSTQNPTSASPRAPPPSPSTLGPPPLSLHPPCPSAGFSRA